MLNFKEFIEEIKTRVLENDPEEKGMVEIATNNVFKNNGLKLTGLTLRNEARNIAPTIYVDRYFEDYENGRSFEAIIEKIERNYWNSKPSQDFDTSFITDYNLAKENITLKVVNKAMNEEFLETVPHVDLGDLSCIFMIVTEISGVLGVPDRGTVTVTNQILSEWNKETEVSAEDLFMIAQSAITQEMTCEHILQTLTTMFEERGEEIPFPLEEPEGVLPMYVVSNNSRIMGAAAIASKESLKKVSETTKGNFFIIPSSIHELLAIPARDEVVAEDLQYMVLDVNATQVDPVDVLSDNVYFFDATKEELSNALTKEVMTLQF